jgi:hypothetical protein
MAKIIARLFIGLSLEATSVYSFEHRNDPFAKRSLNWDRIVVPILPGGRVTLDSSQTPQ